ncbi:MAG: hypothetical protein WB566_04840 [Terriglobales bacterium]
MRKLGFLALSLAAALMLVGTALGQGDNSYYFTTYYSTANTANAPDATLRIINDGGGEEEEQPEFFINNNGNNPVQLSAGIVLWASIYVFDDSEELTQCCSCPITPDGLLSESVNKNLTANPIRGILNTRGVIKVISSSTESDVNTGFAQNNPVAGLWVWATHINGTKVTLSPGKPVSPVVSGPFFVTETQAADSNLVLYGPEQTLLESLCYYDYLLSGKPCTCQPEDYDF